MKRGETSADRRALRYHERRHGKIGTEIKAPLRGRDDLVQAYTPGVAAPSRAIAADPRAVNRYTNRGNTVAVVTDGTAVLGLGNVGPRAALPVMEGKAMLFKKLAAVDAVPVCLDLKDPAAIVATVRALVPTVGGVNLEDIAAPACFDIEAALQDAGIPVMHDDQHGTAVVVLAALENAARALRRDVTGMRVVISGAGAAGDACARILLDRGITDVVVVDSRGIIAGARGDLTARKRDLAERTNPRNLTGDLSAALRDSDVFIGVSAPNIVDAAMIRTMRRDPVVFALANPVPEISFDEARRGGAAIVATGRSDTPNQINNMLGFPGIFRGALDVDAERITPGMLRAASRAVARRVPVACIERGVIVPDALDPTVAPAVARAVARAAMREGVARRPLSDSGLRHRHRAMGVGVTRGVE